MTPIKAFAWTLAYAYAGACVFWIWVSEFVDAGYRYWLVDLLFLCMLAPLAWYVYRSYRKGSMHYFFSKLPKNEQRVMAIVGVVILSSSAGMQIILAWSSFSGHKLSYFAIASVWLVIAADSWRRYLELKGADSPQPPLR